MRRLQIDRRDHARRTRLRRRASIDLDEAARADDRAAVVRDAASRVTRRGALIGLAATGGVITSAGVVLAGTFAALGTLPLVFVTEIGFAVAFGVLLDTFVVRSVLVTALNLDLGRRIWWPSSLRNTPDVDLGELEAEAPVAAR
jgi:RND superfamily putative drug exporter